MLFISSWNEHVAKYRVQCFNLVIEMLFISSDQGGQPLRCGLAEFQSRNRDAFHFKPLIQTTTLRKLVKFQSRNRDAFHFKYIRNMHDRNRQHLFQSRNRDAFHFKKSLIGRFSKQRIFRFQSRNRDAFHFKLERTCSQISCAMFQSRNRDAFHFK